MNVNNSWSKIISDESDKEYYKSLMKFIQNERNSSIVYPSEGDMMNAFNLTPIDKVKVVILGQDPYHGEYQAHGLAFSVPDGIKKPPSLVNIFKEIKRDTGTDIPKSGNLERWAQQGVFLLNSILTVQANHAGSHQNKGWEKFTDYIISQISLSNNHVVFLLWGSYAHKKEVLIDKAKHLILKSVHPSPLSAHRGFLGCSHFSETNKYLTQNKITPIIW